MSKVGSIITLMTLNEVGHLREPVNHNYD